MTTSGSVDIFQHEMSLLREVEGGLRERLQGHRDWVIYQRTAMPTEQLANDHRFVAWRAASEALDALLAVSSAHTSQVSSDASPSASDTPEPSSEVAAAAGAAIQLPIVAPPRRALGAQVAAVTVVHKSDRGYRTSADEADGATSEASSSASPETDDARGAQSAVTGAAAAQELPRASIDVADDLTQIRGITRADAKTLNGLGVYRFAQIAGWRRDDVDRAKAALDDGTRITQQTWIEQAALLAPSAAGVAVGVGQFAPRASEPGMPVAAVAPDQTVTTVEETLEEREVAARRLRRLRRRPLPRFENPRATVGVVTADARDAPDSPPNAHVATDKSDTNAAPIAEASSTAITPPRAALNVSPPRAKDGAGAARTPILELDAIRGMNPSAIRILRAAQVTTTADVAAWTAEDVTRVQAELGQMGRI